MYRDATGRLHKPNGQFAKESKPKSGGRPKKPKIKRGGNIPTYEERKRMAEEVDKFDREEREREEQYRQYVEQYRKEVEQRKKETEKYIKDSQKLRKLGPGVAFDYYMRLPTYNNIKGLQKMSGTIPSVIPYLNGSGNGRKKTIRV